MNNKPAAFKIFCIHPRDLQEAKEILSELVPTWKRLIHENVLPFHGVDMSIFQLALVYDWGHNGNVIQYLKSHPNASRAKLVTVPLCFARDPSSYYPPSYYRLPKDSNIYLHSLDIVHGVLKGVSGAFPRTQAHR